MIEIFRSFFDGHSGASSENVADKLQQQKRYRQMLCHLESLMAHERYKDMPLILPIITERFAAEMKTPAITDLLNRDEIFSDERQILIRGPQEQSLLDQYPDVFEALKNAEGKSNNGRPNKQNPYARIDQESPYIVEQLLYAATRLPEIVTDPRNTSNYMRVEIDRLDQESAQPKEPQAKPRRGKILKLAKT